MKNTLIGWHAGTGWTSFEDADPHLVLCFAARSAIDAGCVDALRAQFPNAQIATCSTGGEILNSEVSDDTAAAALVSFTDSTITTAATDIADVSGSFAAGQQLAAGVAAPNLRCVLILSDGLHVNGARLVEGARSILGDDIVIFGGLAGDGADFRQTVVGLNGAPRSHQLVAIGLAGESLQVGASSFGGWDSFGPERQITRAQGSVLYELDGQPALALYKRYLGEEAQFLPASGLMFPLSIRRNADDSEALTRTILSVNEADQSLTFAGEMPQGWAAQLMRGMPDRIVDGAARAAKDAQWDGVQTDDSLGLLISCIGRKLMLGQRIQEEVEAVHSEWGGAPTIGFYSYGEIGPHGATGRCMLHNQTMTALLLTERRAA
ncbi:MAG: FIST signal transduction protein [Caulobacterales bacterium]|jgi:hypothetical protein